jgi:pimeloyl-ACP methyl ester carboxylesterase
MATPDHPDPLVCPDHRAAWPTDREARSRAGRADIDETGHEPRLVLMIGARPESSLIWTKVQPLLLSHGLTVCTIDRPGHRRGDGAYACLGDYAAAIARILDERHASPEVIVAHSLGIGTALALATSGSYDVHALVLIEPDARQLAVTVTDRVLAAPVIGPALSWIGFRTAGLALHIPALRARMLTRGCGLSVTDAKEVVRSLTCGRSWYRFTAEQRRLVTAAHQLQRLLSEIRCPVVTVTATRGRGLHPYNATVMVTQAPAANIITTDAPRVVPVDDLETVVTAVLQAFTTVPIP